MNKNDFYEKEQMEENVDKLMNDMTVVTANRRNKDVERLSMIRQRQAEKSSKQKKKKGFFGISRKRKGNIKPSDTQNQKEYDASEKPQTQQEYVDEYLGDEDTIIDVEYGYDYDEATIIDYDCIDTEIESSRDDEETLVLEDDNEEETLIMETVKPPAAFIVYRRSEQECREAVFEGRFIIGAAKDKNSIVLDSRYVSRRHAEIVCRNGRLYIIDLNSKNGTYIKGKKLISDTEYEIKPGDVITLADKEIAIYEGEEDNV